MCQRNPIAMEHAKLAKAKLAKATGLAQRSTEACRVCVCLAACGHVPAGAKDAGDVDQRM